MLTIVATPIGNLEDISFRAINTLKTVDCILAEDTKHTKKLLAHYQINTPLQSLHEHNELQKTANIISQIKQGKSFALVSDAGTPLISDPGFVLVSQAKKNGILVSPIPGASAVISALSVSGLPSDKFLFLGFLPSKTRQRTQVIQNIIHQDASSIFYESPKRIIATLETMQEILGEDKVVCLAKELTKYFETILTCPVKELLQWLNADPARCQGEFVLIVSPAKSSDDAQKHLEMAKLSAILLAELPASKAAKIIAKITGLDKKTCYNYLLTQ